MPSDHDNPPSRSAWRRFFEKQVELREGVVLHDDEGTPVLMRDTAPYSAIISNHYRKSARTSGRKTAKVLTIVLVMLYLFGPRIVFDVINGQTNGLLLSASLIVGVVILTVVTTALRIAWTNRKSRRAIAKGTRADHEFDPIVDALREDLCPCCGYKLDQIEPEGDSTRCPECGAAWKREVWRQEWSLPKHIDWHPSRNWYAQWRTIDARGRRVGLLKDLDEFSAVSLANKITTRFIAGDAVLLVAALIPGPVFSVIVALADPEPSFGAALSGTITFTTMICLFVFMPFTLYWRLSAGKRRRYKHISDHRLALGSCPSCNTPIENRLTLTDRRVLCPTCGSAWAAPEPGPRPPEPATLTP